MGFVQDSDGVYRVEALRRFSWLEHGFGTVQSEGWAPPERTATLKQVHSAEVVLADLGTGCLGNGDALVTNRLGVPLAIRTADCIPVLIVDERRRAVAAVHAGWRGTAARIVVEAVRRMGREFGSAPEDLHAAVGPGIGECCYEVGPEVLEQLRAYLGQERLAPRKVDLKEVNRKQLEEAGVDGGRIYVAKLCTQCQPVLFHSFRRDKERAGRMVSAIAIRSE